MIKAIIFDLDGTLADTLDDLRYAMNSMLRHYEWQERSRDDLLKFINKGARAFVWQSLPDEYNFPIDDDIVTMALAIYNDEYAKCYNDKTKAYDGILEALNILHDEYKLGVLSNKQDGFVKIITQKLFPGMFGSVNGQTSIPVKPAPDGALSCAAELGVAAEECVFVGDSDIDMMTAVNSGMYPLGVSWGYRSADVLRESGALTICSTPYEMIDFINKINS